MLNNIDLGDVSSILFKLQNSDLDFYLTGSRFFNNHRENSDYDFFVEDSPGVRQFLKSLGFSKLNNSAYLDDNTVVVYRYMPKSDCYITNDGYTIKNHNHIDIQIVVDAVKKQSVQNIMKYNDFILTGDKTYAKTVWNTLMSIYDAGKSSNMTSSRS
mgnify:CR=1 FL=1